MLSVATFAASVHLAGEGEWQLGGALSERMKLVSILPALIFGPRGRLGDDYGTIANKHAAKVAIAGSHGPWWCR